MVTAVQAAAITTPLSVAVNAGAGSGKTRVLTERIISSLERGVPPGQIVAVTFTDQAAGELRGRMRRRVEERVAAEPEVWRSRHAALAGLRVGTIHALCAQVARAHPAESGAGMAFEILDSNDEILWRRTHLSTVLAALPPEVVAAVPGPLRGSALDALLQDPARAHDALERALGTAPDGDLSHTLHPIYLHVQAEFEALRAVQGVASFADLETWAARALQHQNVQAYEQARCKHLLIDEAQDTSRAQWADILQPLVGDDATLTVVGDVQQSIYAFRGADPTVFGDAVAAVRARSGLVLDMAESFRSTPALVAAVNTAGAHLMPGPGPRRPSATASRPLRAGRTDMAVEAPVEVHVVRGEERQARETAAARVIAAQLQAQVGRPVHDRVLGGVRPARYADMAVLLRTRTHLDDLERALHEAGVPYAVHGGRGLYQRPEVVDAVMLLRAVADPTDDVALAATLRGPCGQWTDAALLGLAGLRRPGQSLWDALCGGTEPAHRQAVRRLRYWRRAAGLHGAAHVLWLADRATGLSAQHAAQPDGARRRANLRRFSGLLREWAQAGRRDLREVAEYLRNLTDMAAAAGEAASPVADAVQVMTVHAAKGREFPIVVVTGLLPAGRPDTPVRFDPQFGLLLRPPQGATPRWTATLPGAREREQSEYERTVYVALTRAEERLIVVLAPRTGKAAARVLQNVLDAFPDTGPQEYAAPLVPPGTPLPLSGQGGRLVLPVRPGPGAALPGHLPVTALAEYARCPLAFRYHRLEGYLPLAWGDHPATARVQTGGRTVGSAVHRALEAGYSADTLPARFGQLMAADRQDVQDLLRQLDAPAFRQLREGTWEREVPFALPLGRVTLDGIVDAVDPAAGTVIDYKTDQHVRPEQHLLQLAVYAAQFQARQAGLVYLRHGQVHWFGLDELQAGMQQVQALVRRMVVLDLAPTPSPAMCGSCVYRGVCPSTAE